MSNSQKPNSNKWLALINIPFQMGLIIFASYKFGEWLDNDHTSEKVYYYIITTMIGVVIALYNVIRQVSDLNRD